MSKVEEEYERKKLKEAAMTGNVAVEVVKGLGQGVAPTNEQIQQTLSNTTQFLETTKPDLTPQGKKVASDLHRFLKSTSRFLTEKNDGEQLQRIYEEAFRLAAAPPVELKATGISETEQEIQLRLAKEALSHSKFILMLLLNSGNFRALMLELADLARIVVKAKVNQIDTQPLKEDIPADEAAREVASQVKGAYKQGMNVILTEEEKDELRERVRIVLKELGIQPQFKNAMVSLFFLLDRVVAQADQKQWIAYSLQDNREINIIMEELKRFVAQFSGYRTLEKLQKNLKTLSRELRNDAVVRNYFMAWKDFINKSLENPRLLEDDKHIDNAIKLFELGDDVLNQVRFKGTYNKSINLAERVIRSIQNDPSRLQVSQDAAILARDLFYDPAGNFSLNTGSMYEMRKILVPAVLEQLKYIPIGRIEEFGETDYVIENLVFKGTEILPDQIKLKNKSKATLSTKEMDVNEAHSILKVSAKDINIHLRDVHLWMKRHVIPRFEDDMNLDMDIKNLRIRIEIGVSGPLNILGVAQGKTPTFTTRRVACHVQSVKVRATKGGAVHDSMVNLFARLFSGTIRRNFENSIESAIVKGMKTIDLQLNQLLAQVPKIKEALKETVQTSMTEGQIKMKEAYYSPQAAFGEVSSVPSKEPTETSLTGQEQKKVQLLSSEERKQRENERPDQGELLRKLAEIRGFEKPGEKLESKYEGMEGKKEAMESPSLGEKTAPATSS